MKIAIIGYGKMGHIIEEIAKDRGHEIVAIIDEHNQEEMGGPAFASADVAIEFSRPDAAVKNILSSFASGVPVVSGTTGWNQYMPEIKSLCEAGQGTLLWSSNFSIGVNIFMALNRYLASLMRDYPQYKPSLTETHHIHKIDHPSGTAVTLAEDLIISSGSVREWEEVASEVAPANRPADEIEDGILPVECERRDEVPGIHTITWDSPVDSLTITHSAKSRAGFALGAVMSAEWLKDKKGFFSMKDFLGI